MGDHGLLRAAISVGLLLAQGAWLGPAAAADGDPFPGTEKLTLKGDLSAQLVEGVDRFLLRKLDESIKQRETFWKREFASPVRYGLSVEPNRQRLAKMLGVRENRISFDAPELIATTTQPALIGQGATYDIFAVRWPVLKDPDPNRSTPSVYGEGLLLVPRGAEAVADLIALPDADQTPEQLVGISKGVAPADQFPRVLVESGCRVLVPVLIDRHLETRNGRANLTNREFIYRSAYELGHHILGYEVQKTLALVDWFARENQARGEKQRRIGVIGYGEGGLVALASAALDQRIQVACVSGYFGSRQNMWQEPVDRNLFGFLREFGDAELASLVMPRNLVIYGRGVARSRYRRSHQTACPSPSEGRCGPTPLREFGISPVRVTK